MEVAFIQVPRTKESDNSQCGIG